MANLIPSGINATTGQQQELTSTDTLTDASGSKVSKILVCETTPVSTVGGGIQTLKTYVFPANSLSTGDQIKITAWGIFGANGEQGEVYCYWGGTAAGDYVGVPVAGTFNVQNGTWRQEVDIAITGASAQETIGWGLSGVVPSLKNLFQITHAKDTTSSITFYLRAANNDGVLDDAVTIKNWRVEYFPQV
jgi:hypothetical protein